MEHTWMSEATRGIESTVSAIADRFGSRPR
jgi:hypothetical protein